MKFPGFYAHSPGTSSSRHFHTFSVIDLPRHISVHEFELIIHKTDFTSDYPVRAVFRELECDACFVTLQNFAVYHRMPVKVNGYPGKCQFFYLIKQKRNNTGMKYEFCIVSGQSELFTVFHMKNQTFHSFVIVCKKAVSGFCSLRVKVIYSGGEMQTVYS